MVSVQASNVATSQLTKPQSMAIAIGNANTSAPGEAMPLVNHDMLMAQCHTLRANKLRMPPLTLLSAVAYGGVAYRRPWRVPTQSTGLHSSFQDFLY